VHRFRVRGFALAITVTVALAACSSSSKAAPPPTSGAALTTVTAASSATVSARSTHLGNVLVNRAGRTLYLYDKDAPGTSKCADACTTVWPPLAVSGTPTYGAGLRPTLFSTIARPDGTKQLAVNGLPLYTYSGDLAPGDTSGQDLGDFFVAGANGKMIGHRS